VINAARPGDRIISPKPSAPAFPAYATPHLVTEASLNISQRAGFLLVLVYLFMLGSRVQDFVSFLHLPMIVMGFALIAVIGSGELTRVMTSRIAALLLGMTVWMGLSVPFSVWIGGAMETYLNKWLQTSLIFVITATLLSTLRHVYYALCMLAFSILVGALLTSVMGGSVAGRLVIDNGSRFADPNDLAQFLLLGMCFALAALKKKAPLFVRIALLPGLALILIQFLRTGSRGGFIGLMAVTLMLFLSSSGRQRVRAVLAGLIILSLTLTVIPQSIRARYSYIFGVHDEQEDQGESSAEARQALFRKSVSITLHHPIVGVGPGMFAVAENNLAIDQGLARGYWHETHNMYTQVSSENGIPALLFFGAILVTVVKRLSAIRRLEKNTDEPGLAEAARVAYWIRLAVIGFLVTGAFLSCAYSELLFVLCGLTVALQRAVNRSSVTIAAPAPSRQNAPVPALNAPRI
jgi:O-antigen ligase